MAIALYALPENVGQEAIADQDDKEQCFATAEKGKRLVEKAVTKVTKFVQRMINEADWSESQ